MARLRPSSSGGTHRISARERTWLGLVWACWHVPLFFFGFREMTSMGSPSWFALGVTALSVAIAWLYMRTNGSLLLTMPAHRS